MNEISTINPLDGYDSHREWNERFISEFARESDRGAVIVAAAIFDSSLESLLKQHLVACAAATDDLFDGANAPLSTFSAKVALCHRLGLISSKYCRNLNLIRRIRNEFAHNIHGGSFDDTSVRSRVQQLCRGQRYAEGETRDRFPKGPRGDFLSVCLWMLWALNSQIKKTQPLSEFPPEFGFLTDAETVKLREPLQDKPIKPRSTG